MKRTHRCLAKLGLAMSAALGTQAHAAVEGYVDLHSHLMGEHAFGGSWFWGASEGPMNSALARCDGNFGYWPGEGSHGATIFPILSEMVGGGLWDGDTGWHLGRRRGYDNRHCKYFLGIKIPGTCPREHFAQWPKWDAIAHQQMWTGHLQHSARNGLKIMAVSLDESEFLCKTTPPLRRRYNCNEMDSIRRQANFLRAYVARNSSWVGIAETPSQARALISQGKLALVMTTEVSKLFPTGNYIQQLDELHALGIRSLQLVHHANNRFAGAAPMNQIRTAGSVVEFLSGNAINTEINDIVCRNASGQIQPEVLPRLDMPFIVRSKCDGIEYINEMGLTPDGAALINAMIDRGMILDVAHLSRKALREAHQIAVARGNYPLTYSHTHMWDTIDSGDHKNEKYLLASEIQMITGTGGMIGLRTGPEPATAYIRPPLAGPTVSNSCKGSARSFAQSLQYAIDKNLNVGFGADLNGFMQHSKGVFTALPTDLVAPPIELPIGCEEDYVQLKASNGFRDIHRKGFGHAGMFPEFIAELKRVGVPQSHMDKLEKHSAEAYLQIWQRGRTLAGITSGDVNMALSASASASSTYCVGPPQTSPNCFSPWRVNDGNASTALGGYYGWTNDLGAALPQSVQLEWAAPLDVSRIVVVTPSSYPVRNYDVQVWIGTPQTGGWQTVATASNNTAPVIPHNFQRVSTWRVRILGRSGPLQEPGQIRVNEIEVYY
ncbi:MAG: hypothetical protein E6Q88_14670 [Lysobacteraceae bacterium]|nr:MAG: hypothetical protein E6Q88_14670 [Xanthomonadaceae bacterium]